MAALLVFKVWDSARKNKISVALTDNDDGMLYNQLVLKASEKLQMDGSKIVLECDGTLIDEDPVLRLLHTQVLLLLSKHQSWEPIDQSPATPLSLSSTITIGSTSPSRSPFQDITEIELNNTQMPTQGDDRVSESTWAHFVLPLHRLGKTLTEECVVGNRINKQAITEVVHIVVDAVREIKADAPSSAFKCLARKLVDQYPKMFEDRDEDGFIIGNGTHSIYNKLQERNHYLNRPHKRKSLKSTLPITPKQKKTMLTAKAGCSKWQPDNCGEITEDVLQNNITFLKEIAKKEEDNILNSDVLTALTNTYALQRQFLNNPACPTIEEVRDTWPILLRSEGVYWHYNELMQHSIHDLMKALHSKSPKILEFGLSKKIITELPGKNIYLEAIQVIAKFFKENIGLLVVSVTDHQAVPINSPCILFKVSEGINQSLKS